MTATPSAIRLNKYISDSGFCSRREADKLIDQGRVTINGIVPEMGTKVLPSDEVMVDHKPVRSKEKPIYIALNKPTGITCTTERHIEGNIIDFIGHHKRIFPIGRLDKPSDGLIFMTNDGDIVNKILRAGNSHEKEYVVRVDKPITAEFIEHMASGVEILDTITLPCKVTKETDFSFRIVLTQGLNRQIRRMCEALGYDVYKLRRVRIMNISIDGLPNGKWRYLTDAEMAEIHAMIEGSVGTEEASMVDADGHAITKATDAKLHDARIQARAEKEREFARQRQELSEQQPQFKTYSGKGEFERKARPNKDADRSGGNRSRNQDKPSSASQTKPATKGSRFGNSNSSSIKKWSPKSKA
ncbi:23S rRNA pseudouridine(2604) synthase RluF [Vibrio sp. S11_S32]|uniref:23S rRNA pseudouridine(2604) synthase RluF n=1 Tax=Vibrio sp. S11_S32 TaxID=2720225 RepID=UPI00168008E2|nr:23S rRNA pseudouridine(2604) synthase RluF [Vibrio sp. S11_S32]MBD1574997.1 23S rRNA pseudouridine(2604) synthase RluF [Vibrio sp. S11_S32]